MKARKMDNIAYMAEITKRIILDFKIRIENTSWKTQMSMDDMLS